LNTGLLGLPFGTLPLIPTCRNPNDAISIDATQSVTPGFALVNGATAVVPPGYRLVDVTNIPFTINPYASTFLGGACAPMAGAPAGGLVRIVNGVQACANTNPTHALLGPGVMGLSTYNPETGERERDSFGKWHALTGSVGVDYTPNDDTLVYFRYAKGYRPGGFGSATAGFLPLNPYTDKESIDSYEIGTKFTLWNKLQMNVSGFYYDYADIQAALTRFERCTVPGDLSSCSPTGVTVNLPSAINQGFEVEGLWYVTSDLQLVVSYGYIDAHIKEGLVDVGFEDTGDPAALQPSAQRVNRITCTPPAAGANPNPLCPRAGEVSAGPGNVNVGIALDAITLQPRWTQDLSGKFLPNAPKNKIAVNLNYTMRIDPGTLTASVSYIWRDKSFSDLFNRPLDIVPEYEQTNARLVFRQKDNDYQVILFAQNVFNQDTFESGGVTRRGSGITAAQQAAALTTLRTVGPPQPFPTANINNTAIAQSEVFYQTYGLVLPRVYGIEILKRFR
jgi:iron complex outermembrane recepter protein